jgi:hypothetical protein
VKSIFKWFNEQANWWGSHSFVWWAGYLTAIYVGLVVMVMASRFDELLTLPLNSLGDFSAGAFGPIAFLWLVLGYKLQGEELKASSAALEAQVAELQKSMELQRLNAEKQDLMVDPVFFINVSDRRYGRGQWMERLVLINKGDTCRDVYIEVVLSDLSHTTVFHGYAHVLTKDMQHVFEFGQVYKDMIAIVVSYVRLNGSKSRKGFNFFRPDVGEPNIFSFSLS